MPNPDPESLRRRLRYRLQRQGMLELDAWLAPLDEVDLRDREMAEAVAVLLSCEPPELLAMMRGLRPVPACLRPWLACG